MNTTLKKHFCFHGCLLAGSIVGLLAAPALINLIGWRAMFVVFGAAGEGRKDGVF